MSREIRITLPQPHYTLFDCQRNQLPEIILVNDSLLSFKHLDVFPWHLRIEIDAKELVLNGMPSPVESEVLDSFGDHLEAIVLSGRTDRGGENALFVARSTWNGLRQLLYQVHDPEIAHAVLQPQLKIKPSVRPWEYEITHDLEWKNAANVFQLFPQAKGRDN
jgi:hypothetical protein